MSHDPSKTKCKPYRDDSYPDHSSPYLSFSTNFSSESAILSMFLLTFVNISHSILAHSGRHFISSTVMRISTANPPARTADRYFLTGSFRAQKRSHILPAEAP